MCLRSAICWDSVLLLAFGTLVRLGSLAWKSPPVIRCWKNSSAASFPPSKLLHIGMKSCGWPHPSNRAPSPPRSCCASWVPTHVQNALALALREIGKLERTLFLLEFIQNIELRERIHAGLNKGEARDALARALFFNRSGELRSGAVPLASPGLTDLRQIQCWGRPCTRGRPTPAPIPRQPNQNGPTLGKSRGRSAAPCLVVDRAPATCPGWQGPGIRWGVPPPFAR